MQAADLQRAWVRQAQADAERGVIECRMCRTRTGLDSAVTLWRNGGLVFAVCDPRAGSHNVLITSTTAGIEVRARRRAPLIVGGSR